MMTAKRVVSNTGPLISLEKLHHGYDFMRQLYDTIIIPRSVLNEVAEGQFADSHGYLQHYGIADFIEVHPVAHGHTLPQTSRLHIGEAQAIQLALDLRLPLLIEETVGRRIARDLGVDISGIAGQIVTAFRRGIITDHDARGKMFELLNAGRINRKIYEALLGVIS